MLLHIGDKKKNTYYCWNRYNMRVDIKEDFSNVLTSVNDT